MKRTCSAILILLAAQIAAPAGWAQEDPARQRQAELFEQLRLAPDDPELMIAYADASLDAGDLESAIATLERGLLYAPDDAMLMMALGGAYYRLGSYPAAQLYFSNARAAGLPTSLDRQAQDFLAAIEARSASSRIQGYVMGGVVASSNANLAPDDRTLLFFGSPFTLPPTLAPESGAGLRAMGFVRHDYDLGRPNLDTWRTELSGYGVNYFSQATGDVQDLVASTGPNLSLTDRAYGPRAHPFVSAELVRVAGRPLYQTYGGGIELDSAFGRQWSGFLRIEAGRRDNRDASNGFDATLLDIDLGAAYAPVPSLTLSGIVMTRIQKAEDPSQSLTGVAARFAADYRYDPRIGDIGDDWALTGYAQIGVDDYFEPDPLVAPGVTRQDVSAYLGLSHRFAITSRVGLRADVDAVFQNSNITNFDFNSVTGALSVYVNF